MTAIEKEQEVVVVDKHGKRHRGVAVLLDSDDLVRDQVGGFLNFLREFSVVGVALGFIVGQQANGVVKQFVASFANPLYEFVFGQDISSREWTVHHGQQIVKIPWGSFVYTLLEFFFVLVSIYLVIKLFKLDRLTVKNKAEK